MSSSRPAVPEPTEIAGRYQIVQKLGAGAFGTVYKAMDPELGRLVAIKTIRLEGLAASQAGRKEMTNRFEREARTAANLKHPGIVTDPRLRRVAGPQLHRDGVHRRHRHRPRDRGDGADADRVFQDDLILKHNEEFSPEANKAFQKEFGYLPHRDLFYVDPYKSESGKYYVKAYTDRFWIWANWKNRWLMNVAKRLMAVARESNPNLQFAINLYFEAVLNDRNGLAWFSQTLSGALENQFDYYAVMAYHRQAMKDRNIEVKEAIGLMADVAQKAVKAVGEPPKVMMKVWILDWKSNEAVSYELAPRKEIEEILTAILARGEVSLAFVPYMDQRDVHTVSARGARPVGGGIDDTARMPGRPDTADGRPHRLGNAHASSTRDVASTYRRSRVGWAT